MSVLPSLNVLDIYSQLHTGKNLSVFISPFISFLTRGRSSDRILPVLFSQLDVSSKMPSEPYQK